MPDLTVLHTSDWHLGARLGRHERLPDQHDALKGLMDIAQDVRPGLILHTGDLFDASRPPYAALRLGVRVLRKLSEIAPTLVVRGNHDSIELFQVIDELAGGGSGGRLRMASAPGVFSYDDIADVGVAVACVPFVPLTAIVNYASDDFGAFEGNYADGIRTLNGQLLDEAEERAGPEGIVLYAAHLHLHGAKPGSSERRLTVGEDYATHAEGLGRALYCAFGHIHDPQLLPGGTTTGRYAGSLIPLDFAEAAQKKEAVVVRIGGDVRHEARHLPTTGRRMLQFAGTLDDLEDVAQDGGLNDILLKARVKSEHPIPDLADKLAQWSPGCAVFDLANEVANRRAKAIDPAGERDEAEEPPLEALFREWRAEAARGAEASDEAVGSLFDQALGSVGVEGAGFDFGASELGARADEILGNLAAKRDG